MSARYRDEPQLLTGNLRNQSKIAESTLIRLQVYITIRYTLGCVICRQSNSFFPWRWGDTYEWCRRDQWKTERYPLLINWCKCSIDCCFCIRRRLRPCCPWAVWLFLFRWGECCFLPGVQPCQGEWGDVLLWLAVWWVWFCVPFLGSKFWSAYHSFKLPFHHGTINSKQIINTKPLIASRHKTFSSDTLISDKLMYMIS